MVEDPDRSPNTNLPVEDESRRSFLKKAGRFAALTPPAVTLLLSTSMDSDAIAGSGGKLFPGGGATGGVFPGGGRGGKRFD
ncbi:hypothetical protein AA309_13230 [Microvirga vignae]|uniref:Ubiquitinol-cytochrome C reductase Fe-S subunit TAT signal domain-containing protein n=1 Tax=Microvirga vignae TaxID=1225564 RepID=A0A0H1RCQ6_9HYPH|nr:hypothetical protein AA309_13230 [Microvirga vignae]